MASHKFVYTVSGIDLSDAQKSKISQEIAAVVTRAVLGESRAAIQPDLLTRYGVAGGKMRPADAVAKSPDALGAFISGGCEGEL